MIISLAYLVMAALFAVSLYRDRHLGEEANAWKFNFFAIMTGVFCVFIFIIPSFAALYEYTNQGGIDYTASEIPTANSPALPPKSQEEFLIQFIPTTLGMIGGIFYALAGVIAALTKKTPVYFTKLVIYFNLLAWMCYFMLFPYGRMDRLDNGQLIMLLLGMGLPSAFAIAFSILWLVRTTKNSK